MIWFRSAIRIGAPFNALTGARRSISTAKVKAKAKAKVAIPAPLLKEKRRTRSNRELEQIDSETHQSHIPVLLGEVRDVFSRPISSFVDCTLGAAGHSSAIIKSHPELRLFVGMDVDPLAYDMACSRINELSISHPCPDDFKVHTFLKNFKHIKSVLGKVDQNILSSGVDGILMDLGMSSMQVNNPQRGFSVLAKGPLDMRMDPQASLKAEDILNSWPETEVGRILREYGEESNWKLLQKRIIQARLNGGMHSTGDLVHLIRCMTPGKGGRQGWIKTATRVFQALRIAVNDELKVLEDSLYTCFDCLAPGGRLAVISFHSLEDRIVKQTFLKIIDVDKEDRDIEEERGSGSWGDKADESGETEEWISKIIRGGNGRILTKRPITPSEEEEKLNSRCRSAKLRVLEKA